MDVRRQQLAKATLTCVCFWSGTFRSSHVGGGSVVQPSIESCSNGRGPLTKLEQPLSPHVAVATAVHMGRIALS